MGHNQNRHAGLRQLPNHIQHLHDHFRVQRGGGFVKENHLRLQCKSPDNGKALLLSAGELRGVLVQLVAKAHAVQHLGLFNSLCLRHHLVAHRGKRYVIQNRQMGKYVEVLEHHTDSPAVGGHIGLGPGHLLSLKANGAAVRLLQQIQAPKEGGLAAAGGADDGNDLALVNVQIKALEHLQLAKVFLQAPYLKNYIFIVHSASSSFQSGG